MRNHATDRLSAKALPEAEPTPGPTAAAAGLRVRVPATSANLGPGFDSFGLALELYDEYHFSPAEKIEVTVQGGAGAELVARDGGNLAIAAARKLCARAGEEYAYLRLHEELQIPIQRGLGSSAGAICAGLVGANALLTVPASLEELIEVAVDLEGHPDNAVPALVGGFCIVLDTGPRPKWMRIELPADLAFVVAVPQLHIPTEAARRMLPRRVPLADAIFNVGRAAMLVAAIVNRDYQKLAHAMEDRLHQPYRAQLHPVMDHMIGAALATGAHGAALSGSGSSIIALQSGADETVALAMRAVCEAAGVPCRTHSLKASARGAHVVAD